MWKANGPVTRRPVRVLARTDAALSRLSAVHQTVILGPESGWSRPTTRTPDSSSLHLQTWLRKHWLHHYPWCPPPPPLVCLSRYKHSIIYPDLADTPFILHISYLSFVSQKSNFLWPPLSCFCLLQAGARCQTHTRGGGEREAGGCGKAKGEREREKKKVWRFAAARGPGAAAKWTE